jgi:uncharacterized caspase-like protein
MSNAFYRLGFQVQTLIDPDRNTLEQAIRKLGRDAEGSAASVFYYSGHAMEVNGQNLLVPASADIRSERDLRFETVDLDSVLDSVSGRSNFSLLILDSCRDNPFIKQLAGSSRAVSLRGLGAVSAAVGTLIAFSTAPGRTALDGDTRNSPFTAALLHNIERPGVEVRHMLSDVRRECEKSQAEDRYLGKTPRWKGISTSNLLLRIRTRARLNKLTRAGSNRSSSRRFRRCCLTSVKRLCRILRPVTLK